MIATMVVNATPGTADFSVISATSILPDSGPGRRLAKTSLAPGLEECYASEKLKGLPWA
jgi:hypothetical protein